MHGIDLNREYFEHAGKPMLQRDFPEVWQRLAAGMAGHGSECFGFDDETSRDHDFKIGFTIYLSRGDEEKYGFALRRAYLKLLKDVPPKKIASRESPLGETEYGVTVIENFFLRHLGTPGIPRNWREWLYTPDYAFAETLNGAVFYDGSGEFSRIRHEIANGMPRDVRLKKLAAFLALAAQSGQYNYSRCLKHGEKGASSLALGDFVRVIGSTIFLLNHTFACYYKWLFRAMRALPILGDLADSLEFLLTGNADPAVKTEIIEWIATQIIAELKHQDMVSGNGNDLEKFAFELQSRIINREIASLHIMEGA
ncbi:MAG: DUF4037 domain-containing protein [Victivallaceae bacterium]|nr:DUF4037 domain-containing protein [Victivallaceae bacterium]